MQNHRYLIYFLALLALASCNKVAEPGLDETFSEPPGEARPWVFWYWIKAAVSEEGITADLEAMKSAGIGGAYLIPVQNVEDPPLYEPPAATLTPEWFQLVEHAFREAKRLDLKIAIHSCDGFAVAGGPWISEEMSMQKVTWSDTLVSGPATFHDTLPLPENYKGFYRDIATFAYPSLPGTHFSTSNPEFRPDVSTNMSDENPGYLVLENNDHTFKSDKEGWIQYSFAKPFLCRSIRIRSDRLNVASNRLHIQCSDDGETFREIIRLEPPRNGWQDYEYDYTYSIPETAARYFRFVYDKEGVEPGSEDMDMSRWSPRLKIKGIQLSGEAMVNQYEAKNGSIWRIAGRSDSSLLRPSNCLHENSIEDITSYLDSSGILHWDLPPGDWKILRMGHTSTGHTNYIGGRGLGLECDKMNADIAAFQFDQWFGRIYKEVGEELSREVLSTFHIDSWECGSQNWTGDFENEFRNRRGYELRPYLALLAGVPINTADFSEKVLYDLRLTIDELVNERFFGTMAELADGKGCLFSSESLAPVMVGDNMTHYKYVDLPMGEFWFNSPTHDKHADVLDAISAGHVYGKNIIQSEAFTTLRMDWNEDPAALKGLGDRNFALGVNKLVFHVFTQNPWMDKVPGMTLNTVGLYFQRDQSWWEPGKAWIEYLTRSQALLQVGNPVVDIAVFTGEELPRRSLTPDRLLQTVPGLFSDERRKVETERLANAGNPMKERPYSVNSSANTFDPENWIDPLRGYKYDSFNKDALLTLAHVKKGKVIMGNGAYSLLIIPGPRKASPEALLSVETARKLLELVKDGATLVLEEMDPGIPGQSGNADDEIFELLCRKKQGSESKKLGKGRIIFAERLEDLESIGILPDLVARVKDRQVEDVAWAHRQNTNADIYFVSNQAETTREIKLSLRTNGAIPLLFNPINGEIYKAARWKEVDDRTELTINLDVAASTFVVFDRSKSDYINTLDEENPLPAGQRELKDEWSIQFLNEKQLGEARIVKGKLFDWSLSEEDEIKYYSGSASYSTSFMLDSVSEGPVYLDLGQVESIAEVFINGENCGIAWTPPFRLSIGNYLQEGENQLEIIVSNTWKNRIIGDNTIFKDNPYTFTTAPYRIKGQGVVPSGLLGPVRIIY